jgi:hypothetical protein
LFEDLFVVFEGLGIFFGDKKGVSGFESEPGSLGGGDVKATDNQEYEWNEKF